MRQNEYLWSKGLIKKLNISFILLNLFCYKAHILYEGTSHRYPSASTKLKVICRGQGKIPRSHLKKKGSFGGISVSQTCLVLSDKVENIVGKEENTGS